MDPRADLAARNNAEWCDLVCRAHGIETVFDEDGWFAGRRTPRFYPDAVTLREGLAAGDLLPRIDSSPGCSIKDSFASVDLSGDGFGLLFEAEWIHREPTPQRIGSGLRWAAMQTAEGLAVWTAARGDGHHFDPSLLDNAAVAFLLALDGDVPVAGAIANRSAGAVGLSNLFSVGADPDEVWVGASDAIAVRFPGLPLVGYERGASLSAARRAGFVTVGPLRVWANA